MSTGYCLSCGIVTLPHGCPEYESPGTAMAKMRWAKRSPAERKAHSVMMVKARKKRRAERRALEALAKSLRRG